MKHSLLAFATIAICGMMVTNDSVAESKSPLQDLIWVVYRDADGNLTKESKKFAHEMEKKATREGHITLWLTSNVLFNPYLDELSDQQIAKQNEAVKDSLDAVLGPLVDAGSVWHPAAGQHIRGPGCLVRANAEGVAQLVQDSRIIHIVEI